jgi:GntR family transcriptional regulator
MSHLMQVDRVYAELSSRLHDGRMRNGDRLPAERVLCQELSVSRVTLRRALAMLRQEGTISSVQGAGTFVTVAVLREAPNNLLSFSKLSESRGLVASSQLLQLEEHGASIEEAKSFGIVAGSPVVILERVRLLDGMAIALSRSLVPLASAPTMMDVDWTNGSLYDELARGGNQPVRADQAIEARAADDRIAAFLGIAPGDPVLWVASRSFAADGRVVEASQMTYRGDRYRFRNTVFQT